MGTMASAASGPVYRVEKSRTMPIFGAVATFIMIGLSMAVFYLAYLSFTTEDEFLGGVYPTMAGIAMFSLALLGFDEWARPYLKKGYILLSLERVQYFEEGALKTDIEFDPSVVIDVSMYAHTGLESGLLDGMKFTKGEQVLDVSNFTGYEVEDITKLRDFLVKIVLHNQTRVGKEFLEYAKRFKIPHPGATPPGR